MLGLQHQMLRRIDFGTSLLRRRAPRQKYYTSRPYFAHSVDDLLRKTLPTLALVAIRLVCADRKASVEHQDTLLSPGGQQATVIRWWSEGWVVVLQSGVHVFERGRRWSRGPDGEAETMCLVVIMVGVLAYDNSLHG